MKSISLIQISDIHYPDSITANPIIDRKDQQLPDRLISAISPTPLKTVLRKILKLIGDHEADGILICGDLTSKGDIIGYKNCVTFINDRFIDGSKNWNLNNIHVVPGNHDIINRLSIDYTSNNLFDKFEPIINAWKRYGYDILPISSSRITNIKSENGSCVKIFSLNSCIGCGERRFLPEKIRDEMANLLRNHSDSLSYEQHEELLYEDLDTPAFDEENFSELCHKVKKLPKQMVPLLVCHHGFLPQAKPRIDIYSELLNGGLVRERLLSCRRPVIYCHGHIHDDPVELVMSPESPTGKIISISAPVLTEGFNLIKIEFSSNTGIPLGCIISKYRFQRTEVELLDTPFRIPLYPYSVSEMLNRNPKLGELFKCLSSDSKKFHEIRDKLSTIISPTPQKQTLSNITKEAEWLGLVQIDDSEDDPKYWRIRRLIHV